MSYKSIGQMISGELNMTFLTSMTNMTSLIDITHLTSLPLFSIFGIDEQTPAHYTSIHFFPGAWNFPCLVVGKRFDSK